MHNSVANSELSNTGINSRRSVLLKSFCISFYSAERKLDFIGYKTNRGKTFFFHFFVYVDRKEYLCQVSSIKRKSIFILIGDCIFHVLYRN